MILDGESLTLEDLVRAACDPRVRVEIAPEAVERVRRGREEICGIVERYRAALAAGEEPHQDYGVTTGFGEFKDIPIAPDELEELRATSSWADVRITGRGAIRERPSVRVDVDGIAKGYAIDRALAACDGVGTDGLSGERLGLLAFERPVGGLACADCHEVHAPRDPAFDKLAQQEKCFACHQRQRSDTAPPPCLVPGR